MSYLIRAATGFFNHPLVHSALSSVGNSLVHGGKVALTSITNKAIEAGNQILKSALNSAQEMLVKRINPWLEDHEGTKAMSKVLNGQRVPLDPMVNQASSSNRYRNYPRSRRR